MALAFRSHGYGSGPKSQNWARAEPSDPSSSTSRFHAAKTPEEQPIIPPDSLFASLNDDDVNTGLPRTAECAVHLELLEAFLILKQKVSTSNVLDRALGIRPDPRNLKKKTFQQRRDMKWPIYTWLAAARFLKWWTDLGEILKNGRFVWFKQDATKQLAITDATLPPLDVLLIWHSLMLNPQKYAEFCKKHGPAEYHSINLPWQSIHRAMHLNNRSFTVDPKAAALFRKVVGDVDLFSSLAHIEADKQVQQPQDGTTSATPTPTAWLTESQTPEFIMGPFWDYLTRTSTISKDTVEQAMLKDLSAAVLRQDKFAEKMGNYLWIRSPAIEGTLRRAINRYENFLRLFKEHPRAMLVPTHDIDLVWHTHQCSPQVYKTSSIEIAGRFINHDDSLGKSFLDDRLQESRCMYEDRYKEEYTACLCWDCEAMKSELERFDAQQEVDFDEIAKNVKTDVTYHKTVEAARRAELKKILSVQDK